MDFNIYTLGDIDFVWSAFNGIALIFSQYKGVREFMTTAACLAAAHLIYKTIVWIQNPLKNELPVFNFIMGLIIFSMAITRVDVTLESVKTGEVRAVDDVPIFIAATASLTTSLSQGLLRDYKTAFDPLSPPDLSSTTLDDDLTLGPMIKFVKFMRWGGDSQGYCSLFPSPDSKIGNLNLCLTVRSVVLNCLKATQQSSGNIASKENIFNDIFSADMSDSMSKITAAVKGGMQNASALLVGTNGSTSKSCDAVWNDVLTIRDSAESRKIMETIGQVNGILSPDDAAGAGGVDFTNAMKSANGLYTKSLAVHDTMINSFLLRLIQDGAQSYRSSLGVNADMQLFEASMKRTNAMAAQGQLWMQLSGAAIAFLEMFAYMVAPFSLLMLIALGANGITAAAKYLQLVVFVNMWPITAVMVNAYIKKVLSTDLDTWTTLNTSNSAVTWSGLPGLAETYSSYLSVASALYAMIPVLTLFIMTQSIHPMMSAAKGVMPEAPVNTSHLTPQVWSSADAGKSSFGDQTHISGTSTGMGMSTGGFNDSKLPDLGAWKIGQDRQSSFGQGAQSSRSSLQSDQRTFSQALTNASEMMRSGGSNTQYSNSAQHMMSLVDNIAAGMTDQVMKNTGLLREDAFNTSKAYILSAGLGGNAEGSESTQTRGAQGNDKGEGGKSGVSSFLSKLGLNLSGQGQLNTTSSGSEKLTSSLQGALQQNLSNNLGQAEQLQKAFTSLRSDTSADSASVKNGLAEVQQASQSLLNSANQSVSTDGKVGSSTGMQLSQEIDLNRVRDTMSGNITEDKIRAYARSSGVNEEDLVGKYSSYLDTFSKSNAMGDEFNSKSALVSAVRDIGVDKVALKPGETGAEDRKDLQTTASMLKNLETMFGANAQQLDPAVRQLSGLADDKTAQFVENSSMKLGSPDTSQIQSPQQFDAAASNLQASTAGRINEANNLSSQRPAGTVEGQTVDTLNKDDGRNAVISRAGINADNVGSSEENAALKQAQNKLQPMTTNNVDNVAANSREARRMNEAVALPGTAPQQEYAGPVETARKELGADRTIVNGDDYVQKINSNSSLSPAEKQRELLQQAAFSTAVASLSGNEHSQLKQEAQESAETIRQELNRTGMSVSRDDLSRYVHQASGYNNGGATLATTMNAVVPNPMKGEVELNTDILNKNTGVLTPAVTEMDSYVGKQMTSTDSSAHGRFMAAKDGLFSVGGGITRTAEGMNLLTSSGGEAASIASVHSVTASVPVNTAALVRLNNMGDVADKNLGLASGSERYRDQAATISDNIGSALSNDPNYGPEAAEKFKAFYSSIQRDMSQSDIMDKTSEWLQSQKKNQ